ncbi:two component transcriptional regulator, winged helix family [Desulfurobacterium thermolithotrophum DSM 11699]|uniref:Two component transcriptional regulator, winged helix family n=1 Tax=Desulfurobacterium thermolithotrophum (strain DSM 11699 / BSA) TaxID=868864 RepID=F0S0A6_DESTD|nr:response regulator transcription factor [Desulfurobacterium thermolithotrophum]ADY73785.1 two component transcriptional regulator, winged helix family [Desulfurobacterium thermolithotrophum DSM 11699]
MKILLVEDEKLLANTLKKGLEEEGYIVDVAYDGEEGFFLGRCYGYDVIILDVMLPKLDGMELLLKLREEGVKTPILMLTAKDSVEDKVKGLDSGADDYLTKPFSYDELLARIRALLRRKSESKTSFIKIKDLEIDLNKKIVKRAGNEIKLTKKEFKALTLLALNKNRVISKEFLIDSLYSTDRFVSINAIEVLINRLRKKIDKDYPLKLIHTIKGFGYMIKDD